MKRIILIILVCLLLCSCYDYKELNDMSIVSGIGIDYKDNQYIVNLEITKSSKEGSATQIETYVVSGVDSNIVNAFTKAKNKSDKMLYTEHVLVLVLSKDLCTKGIDEVIDYIIRDTKINNNYFVVIADDTNEILKKEIKNNSSSEIIVSTIKYYLDTTTLNDLDLIASKLINNTEDIALPYIEMKDENIIFDNVGYFDGTKLMGFINCKMYNFLKLDTVNVNFSQQQNTINIHKKKIDYEIKDAEVIIKIDAYGEIKKIDKDINLEDENSYYILEKKIEDIIILESNKFLDETLKMNSDLLGLNNIFFKKYKKDMQNIKYSIKCNLKINKNGTIYGVLHDN